MDYITAPVKAPQLSADDLANLSPADVNRARRLGQLDDQLTTPTPTPATEPMSAAVWERLSPHVRDAMLRAHGPSIAPNREGK